MSRVETRGFIILKSLRLLGFGCPYYLHCPITCMHEERDHYSTFERPSDHATATTIFHCKKCPKSVRQ